MILCAFQTDAAWFVLAYLLSPDVIATSQRTTASLLTNLHSWVAMDKVVAVLRILLEPKRRWAIQVYLHKAILRMLLDTASADRSLFARTNGRSATRCKFTAMSAAKWSSSPSARWRRPTRTSPASRG